MLKVGLAVIIIMSALAAWPCAEAAEGSCKGEALTSARAEFQRLRDARSRDRTSVPEEDFRAASRHYIELAEACYQAEYGKSAADGRTIDDGGLWANSGRLQPRHNLYGTKWGAGSPFLTPGDNPDAAGPRQPGGEVTYSFMAGGVSIGNDGGTGASCVPTCSNTDLFSFVFTDSGGDTEFARCLLSKIDDAFAAWSAVADITFTNVTDNGVAFDAAGASGDIRIGLHPIDGAFGTLAHAFFPPPNGTSAAGDLHFDVDEPWNCSPLIGSLDIGIVALHELGHSIGLRHEQNDTAVMNPSYNEALTFGPLADDIIGAGEIYGESGTATTVFFGDVGIGTDGPNSSLHIARSDGSAQLRVEESSGTAQARSLLVLQNNGRPGLRFFNNAASGATQWALEAGDNGDFLWRQNDGTSPGIKLMIKDGSGDMTVAGDVTANGVLLTSDMAQKENIMALDPQETLQKVIDLPISRWTFKERPGVTHIGPMAQDFFRLFAVGPDDSHISPMDASGVALAAIRGLYGNLADKEAKLRSMEERLLRQDEELEALKRELKQMQALISSLGRK